MVKGQTRFKVRQELAPVLLKKINAGLEAKLSPDHYLKWKKIMSKESSSIFSFELFRNDLNLFKLDYRYF
jgi:hypothetical protein